MRKRSMFWPVAVAITALALLASVAGAASRTDQASALGAISASVNADLTGSATVMAADRESASEPADQTGGAKEEANEANEAQQNENEPEDQTKSAEGPHDQTTGARPGFGCGDENHQHSGPPGRPGATPPPGCANAGQHESDHSSSDHSSSDQSNHSNTSGAAINTSGSNHGERGKGKGGDRD